MKELTTTTKRSNLTTQHDRKSAPHSNAIRLPNNQSLPLGQTPNEVQTLPHTPDNVLHGVIGGRQVFEELEAQGGLDDSGEGGEADDGAEGAEEVGACCHCCTVGRGGVGDESEEGCC